ncbi:accessory gene regulator B family protein [Anaeromicropila herbilytica]|nr:accessory gene regulator B family protein [Anaeromicropila herbilytica]
MIKEIANRLSNRLNKDMQLEGIDKIKLEYGTEIIVNNVFHILIVSALAIQFGMFQEVFIMLLSFKLCRGQAHGLHAKNLKRCMLYSCILILLTPYIAQRMVLPWYAYIIIFILFFIAFSLYAPADTEKNPIIGDKVRQRLRMKVLSIYVILFLLVFCIPIDWIKNCIVYGITLEVISILPITYKILGKRRNNYEKYEKDFAN